MGSARPSTRANGPNRSDSGRSSRGRTSTNIRSPPSTYHPATRLVAPLSEPKFFRSMKDGGRVRASYRFKVFAPVDAASSSRHASAHQSSANVIAAGGLCAFASPLATFGHRFDFVVACWQEENSMIVEVMPLMRPLIGLYRPTL